jgi:hypothetical protein
VDRANELPPERANWRLFPSIKEFLEVRVQFSNTGRTPAINIRFAVTGVIVSKEDATKVPRFSESDYVVGGVIDPGGGGIARDVKPSFSTHATEY